MEMTLRGFNHNSPCSSDKNIEGKMNHVSYIDLPEAQFEILRKKYNQKNQRGRIPLPGTEPPTKKFCLCYGLAPLIGKL
jgi:hypothetical protein